MVLLVPEPPAHWSLPSRECGLKSDQITGIDFPHRVTPFAGVWIEMCICLQKSTASSVTPFAGVWIEIDVIHYKYTSRIVTPFAGVWIEIQCHHLSSPFPHVTPFAGVWIEIVLQV